MNGEKVGETTAGNVNRGNARIKRIVGGGLVVVGVLGLLGLFKLSRILVADFRGDPPRHPARRRE